MDKKNHWEKIYTQKNADDVSWFQERPEKSLEIIQHISQSKDDAIIDVGGGASTLVDYLYHAHYKDITILDLSVAALEQSKLRLQQLAEQIEWLEGDITAIDLPKHRYQIWHDRAVFHFLTQKQDREKYVELVSHSVKPGGYVLIATFGLDGPDKCSGLPIVKYDPDSLHNEFGARFALKEHHIELHDTPFGTTQQFMYCYCLKE